MKFILFFLIDFWLFYFSFQLNAYFNFEFFCVDDTIDRIKYSGGEIKPNNPQNIWTRTLDYIYYFPELKHNMNETLCIILKNKYDPGYFSFKKALLNEYDISEIDFKKYWKCSNCNINSPYNYTYNELCNDKPHIYLSYYSTREIRYNDFCIIPTNDISIFNIGEKYINKNYYIGKINNFILNDEINKFK